MALTADADRALEQVRAVLQADGFGISLAGIDSTRAVVVITAEPDACVGCLAPDDMLEVIVLDVLQPVAPRITSVEVRRPTSTESTAEGDPA